MNPNSSFESPVRTRESFGEFMKPNFSPSFTSSPYQTKNESTDFIPFGPSTPRSNNRGRGQWRGNRNRSILSNASSSGLGSFSSGMGQRQSSFSSSQRSSPYKPNNTYGSWRGRGGNKGYQKNTSQNYDMTNYYHPSMLLDPWAALEEKMNNSECSSSQSLSIGNEGENDLQSSDTDLSVIDESSVEKSSQESVA